MFTLKSFVKYLTPLAILALTTSAASAASVSLTGTVRDFKRGDQVGGHPDFETFLGIDRGIVQSTLGVDGKPVYAGSPTTLTTTGKANFDQWYRDTPGVNLSTPFSLTLAETSPGIYSYNNDSFFPIDNQLSGNQGFSHNYSFTYELPTQFTYQPGQSLNVTGDDDIWVFINKQLVLDVGGVHATQTAGVNLDNLGLIAGQTYDFNLFFAERHNVGSHLQIDTSIAFQNQQKSTPIADQLESTPRANQLESTPEPSTTISLVSLGLLGIGLMKFRH